MFQLDRTILAAVALDETTDEILRQAEALASFHKVDLHACHVLPELYAARPLFPHLHLDDALKLAELEASVRDALLKRIRAVIGRGPGGIELIIEQGTAHAGILRAAETIGAGIIVVGGKANAQGLAVLGGTAEHVVRYAHCPVLVARPSPAGKVLAATDFSDPALPAIEAAACEARRREAELVIIHAIELLPMALPTGDGMINSVIPIDFSKQLTEACRQQLEECVHRFAAKGGGLLRHGPAAQAILDAALKVPAQLLVVGTRGRTGMSRLALGSVAEAVVRSAPCSTLVVRLA
jgi:nucleotide-binding universal stress UspA family protein